MKVCSKCKEEKDNSEFHVSITAKDGLQNMCKQCKALANKTKNEIDDTEAQLIAAVTEARTKLRDYRMNRATKKEIERQVAEAAVQEFRQKAAQAGGSL